MSKPLHEMTDEELQLEWEALERSANDEGLTPRGAERQILIEREVTRREKDNE